MANVTQTFFHRRENDFIEFYDPSLTDGTYISLLLRDIQGGVDFEYSIIWEGTSVHTGNNFQPWNISRNNNKAATSYGPIGSWANGPGWPPDPYTGTGSGFADGVVLNSFLSPCNKGVFGSSLSSLTAFNPNFEIFAYAGTYRAAELLFADEYAYIVEYLYSLKIGGPPPYLAKTIRLDTNFFENSIQRNSSDNNAPMQQFRFTIYDSDAFFQSTASSYEITSGNYYEGGYGYVNPITSPTERGLIQKTRHESSSNETMGEADDIRLIVNNTGEVKYKFKRANNTNHRILFYKDGTGSPSVIQNNSNNTEQTSEITLLAGVYTVNWQKGSWQVPNNESRCMLTGEDP